MRKIILKFLSVILSFVMLATPAFAATRESPVFTGEKGELTINYRDSDNEVVKGAGFTLYKIADFKSRTNNDSSIGTGYQSIIPGMDVEENTDGVQQVVFEFKSTNVTIKTDPSAFRDSVLKAYDMEDFKDGLTYECKTDDNGKAIIKNIQPAVYLLIETSPAKEHFACVPVTVSIPQIRQDGSGWNYEVTVEPKSIPSGNLKLTKKVIGNNVEKNRPFHFNFTVSAAEGKKTTAVSASGKVETIYIDPAKLSYSYENTNGEKGKIKSGETISVTPGNSVTIYGIPTGAKYKIKEEEANKEGYKTTSANEKGNIVGKQTVKATFINSRNKTIKKTKTPGGKEKSNINKTPGAKTGDNVGLMGILVLIAAVVMIIVAKKKRNRG